jgi:hypothetical protein
MYGVRRDPTESLLDAGRINRKRAQQSIDGRPLAKHPTEPLHKRYRDWNKENSLS